MCYTFAMKKYKVIVAFTIDGTAGRECLSGIFNFINRGRPWIIKFFQDPQMLTPDFIRQQIEEGANGFITGFRTFNDSLRTLEKSQIPVVFTDYPKNERPDSRHDNFLIRMDDLTIGRNAAKYFYSRATFRSYAFIPTATAMRWSTFRERGYRLELGKHGIIPRKPKPHNDLKEFLLSLPKPAAVFASSDYDAIQTIETCHDIGVRIPDQLAILGVDNDELLCNSSRPTLSSIHPDHVSLGFQGAKALDYLMTKRRLPKSIPTAIQALKIVERDSSHIIPPAGHLIRDALTFIRENALKGISVDDVARELHVSKRLLYARFKQMQEEPIHQTLLNIRLGEVKRKLTHTSLPVKAIAEECGFGSGNRLSHLFKERFGLSPADYRVRSASSVSPRFPQKSKAVTR